MTLMGHPISSESGKFSQKWILFHAIQDLTDFWLTWDPTDPDDIKLLQKYVGYNGSVVYLPSSTIKNLISLWNYMYLLIKRERPVDQKCNVLYFLLDDQWFNLTAHDMMTTLVNAGREYHEPQIIPGTSLPNSTSPPSPAPMRSPIHLELTPCDSTSTTTLLNKTCPSNTSCDDLPCIIETEFLPEFEEQLDHTNLSPTDVFSGHHDNELFLLQKEINPPHDNLSHQDTHVYEEQDQDVILTHATILSHNFALPQFMNQNNYDDQDPTDTPITEPTTFQFSCDHTLHPECAHNLMAIQCNQYPNLNHNLALLQFLAHHNCEDLDPTDTPSGGY